MDRICDPVNVFILHSFSRQILNELLILTNYADD